MSERGLYFTCIVYPESAQSDWLSKLEELHIQAAVSPLHYLDIKEDGSGEYKKEHFHVILKYSSLKSFKQVQSDFDTFGGVYPKSDKEFKRLCLIRSPDVSFRYFTHEDYPDKAQYNAKDVLTFGGLDYITECENKDKTTNYILEICDFCIRSGTTNFMRLCIYAKNEHPEWFMTIVKYTYFIRTFMQNLSLGSSSVDGFFPDLQDD